MPEETECPFCAGNEHMTPPETLRLGNPWRVRVVPNLYPAVERQEVVVHTPQHVTSFADLGESDVELVAAAWRERARVARQEGFAYVHALVNEGRAAGASRAHTHSQLVWLRQPPPAVAAERFEAVRDLVGREELLVAAADGVAAVCHAVPRLAFEVVIAPVEPEAEGLESARVAVALGLLADVVRRLRAHHGEVSWNAWLHDGPHWHVELVPRLGILAGLELGAGIYVSTIAPERAAETLRTAG